MVRNIPTQIFLDCVDLIEVELNDGLQTISKHSIHPSRSNRAFCGCKSLTEVELNDNLAHDWAVCLPQLLFVATN